MLRDRLQGGLRITVDMDDRTRELVSVVWRPAVPTEDAMNHLAADAAVGVHEQMAGGNGW